MVQLGSALNSSPSEIFVLVYVIQGSRTHHVARS
jgi:hypothetical protein